MTETTSIPPLRLRQLGDKAVNPDGAYVLHWMTAYRRVGWNFALQRAVDWAVDLNKPLVVFEALRCDYRWASDRLHYFIIQGMADNQRALSASPVSYFPYVEPTRGDGQGLLAELARHSCVVTSDDFPCFFLPRMMRAAARQIPVRFELIDSNGLLPMRAADKVFARAYDFRRFLQRKLRPHLDEFPAPNPLRGVKLPQLAELPESLTLRWPAAPLAKLAATPMDMTRFPIDHSVPAAPIDGGSESATACLRSFVAEKLTRYDERNQPDDDTASGLSPYLHFGHISPHQVFADVTSSAGWNSDDFADTAKGSSSGWWGTSEAVESFLDELITWRELGYNMCWQRDDYDRYESLPDWAQTTLAEHTADRRAYVYGLEEFAQARTHDELWNAAQRQLLREGRIHNYLRMLWGKKILEWSASPREALDVMIELNNKLALDGRNPNSYSGIFWVLGRYDRAWGPERPIFGKIRYMSSENTARKLRVACYLEKYGSNASS
ncbi:MAG: deoxyribodipyrimidine photolyase [Planctomycetales bacterium]|nr:deoxyribodipyrimidine photolyase [Planctomycetales bacterium]